MCLSSVSLTFVSVTQLLMLNSDALDVSAPPNGMRQVGPSLYLLRYSTIIRKLCRDLSQIPMSILTFGSILPILSKISCFYCQLRKYHGP